MKKERKTIKLKKKEDKEKELVWKKVFKLASAASRGLGKDGNWKTEKICNICDVGFVCSVVVIVFVVVI